MAVSSSIGRIGAKAAVLLSGDNLQVVPSGHVSLMWSYPNLIPLSAAKVQRMPAGIRGIARRGLRLVFGPGVGRRKRRQPVAGAVARYIARISET